MKLRHYLHHPFAVIGACFVAASGLIILSVRAFLGPSHEYVIWIPGLMPIRLGVAVIATTLILFLTIGFIVYRMYGALKLARWILTLCVALFVFGLIFKNYATCTGVLQDEMPNGMGFGNARLFSFMFDPSFYECAFVTF